MWVDKKYIALLASNVRNFKKKQNNVWEFSCPLCGDSARDRRKARGYIYLKSRTFRYRCHNCGDGRSFSRLLEHVNPNLYREFRFEKFKENHTEDVVEKSVEASDLFFSLQTTDISKLARKMSLLDESHEAFQYLKRRQIPIEWFDRLYFCDNMNNMTELFPEYKDTVFAKEPRIVLPIYNRGKDLIGITARAIKPSKLRYIMLRKSDDAPLIFNLGRVSINRKVYAFEGAFDSMFCENAVAVDGADFSKLNQLVPKEQTVVVCDNQPRNAQLLRRIEKIADEGYAMFVWPETLPEKDMNENIVDGYVTPERVKHVIDRNTYKGMSLKMKLANWKKLKPNDRWNNSQSN